MTEETQNELIPLKKLENPLQIFNENEMDKLIDEIKDKANDFTPDISTDKGRREIASMSYKVSTSKTALIALSKELTDDWRTKTKAVDAVRIKMCSDLDDLRDEVRKPLTDYENFEKQKIADFNQIIIDLQEEGNLALEKWQEIEDGQLETVQKFVTKWECQPEHEEWQDKFDIMKNLSLEKINLAIQKREIHDKEQDELKALREADAKRQEEEDEKNRIQADKDAQAERERYKAEEQARIEKERADAAEEARKLAEQIAKEEAEKVAEEQDLLTATLEQNKRDADAVIQKQKDDAKAAEIESEKRTQQARVDEREKIQAEENKRLADEKRREENIEHQRKINNEAVEGLVKAGIQKPVAVAAIKAIIVGDVPHIKISY